MKWFKSLTDGGDDQDHLYLGYKDTTNTANARVKAVLHTLRYVEKNAEKTAAEQAAERGPKLLVVEDFSEGEDESESESENEVFSHLGGPEGPRIDESTTFREYKDLLPNAYLRDFFIGRGYTIMLDSPTLPSGMDRGALTAVISRISPNLNPENSTQSNCLGTVPPPVRHDR